VTHSLTDQRSRPELIAELFDRHAAGLFAYCADQLGDPGSAADVLVAVLTSVPSPEPPRAALYAFARREVHRRDVVFAPPVVDPLLDPASALVERALRELRPQQREVLVLCQVCGLNRAELAWVLDVAPDTAEELAVNAAQRFTQLLGLGLAAVDRRLPKPLADVYGALSVAPLRDVLGRLPWQPPPATLRVHVAGSRTAEPAPLFVKPRWPVSSIWPQPLGRPDPATTTAIFPAELLTPPSRAQKPAHEATTTPMPKLRDRAAPERSRTASPERRSRSSAPDRAASPTFAAFQGPKTPFAAFEPRRMAPREPAPRPPKGAGERPFIMPPAAPADVLDDEPVTQELPVIAPARTGAGQEAAPLFTPRARTQEPVYRMPLAPSLREPSDLGPATAPLSRVSGPLGAPVPEAAGDDPFGAQSRPGEAGPGRRDEGGRTRDRRGESDPVQGGRDNSVPVRSRGESDPVRSRDDSDPVQGGRDNGGKSGSGSTGGFWDEDGQAQGGSARRSLAPPGVARRPARPRQGPHPARPGKKISKKKRRDRHHDWAWEVAGFLLCVVIAMIVFFSVPMLISP